MVVLEKDIPWTEAYFYGMVFKVVAGSHYLSGFISYQGAEFVWPAEKLRGCRDSVETMTEAAHRYL